MLRLGIVALQIHSQTRSFPMPAPPFLVLAGGPITSGRLGRSVIESATSSSSAS